jgi:hypothetical protein
MEIHIVLNDEHLHWLDSTSAGGSLGVRNNASTHAYDAPCRVVAVDGLDSRDVFRQDFFMHFNDDMIALVIAQQLQLRGHQQPLPLLLHDYIFPTLTRFSQAVRVWKVFQRRRRRGGLVKQAAVGEVLVAEGRGVTGDCAVAAAGHDGAVCVGTEGMIKEEQSKKY